MSTRRGPRRHALWLTGAAMAAIVAVVAVDAWTAGATSRGAQALSINALRSVELAEDMRWQLSRLGAVGALPESGDPAPQALEWLERDVAVYEPLATFEGEHPEWSTLARLSHVLEEDVRRGDGAATRRDVEHARESVRRLTALNRAAADAIGSQLLVQGRHQLWVDALAGAVVVLVLAQVVAARLRSIERERELAARSLEAVESKNRNLEAFAGRVAHDLQSPLVPIHGLAQLLLRGERDEPEIRRVAGRILGAASRMSELIDAMLAFSRSGQLPPGRSSLRSAVQDVVMELAPSPAETDIEVDVVDETVECAPEVLGQILRNVLGNALKYRAVDRRCRVEILGRARGRFVVVEVSDNGIGMDPASAGRAFEPFFRASSDRAGHGLGLAIVQGYLHALGGSAGLDSEPGVGTRVELRLPRSLVHGGNAREAPASGAANPADQRNAATAAATTSVASAGERFSSSTATEPLRRTR